MSMPGHALIIIEPHEIGALSRDQMKKLGIKLKHKNQSFDRNFFFSFLHQKVNRASHDHRFDSLQRCVAMGLHRLSGSGEQYLPCRKFLFRISGPLQ